MKHGQALGLMKEVVPLKTFLGWLLFVILAIGMAGFGSLFLSPDYNIYLVRSDSMKPAINAGDMIITAPVNGQVRPGDIVTYERVNELVTHRVVSIDGDKLVTKGDALQHSDPWSVTLSDVKGSYLFRLPYVGYLSNFIKTRLGWLLVIILPATALVAFLIKDIVKEAKRVKGVMPIERARLNKH
ncbi:hypothetical protein ES703_109851 [subsurface metagenome]